MTPEHILLLEVREEIAKMPADDRIRVEEIASTLRNAINAGGAHGLMALALVGAEMQDSQA